MWVSAGGRSAFGHGAVLPGGQIARVPGVLDVEHVPCVHSLFVLPLPGVQGHNAYVERRAPDFSKFKRLP